MGAAHEADAAEEQQEEEAGSPSLLLRSSWPLLSLLPLRGGTSARTQETHATTCPQSDRHALRTFSQQSTHRRPLSSVRVSSNGAGRRTTAPRRSRLSRLQARPASTRERGWLSSRGPAMNGR